MNAHRFFGSHRIRSREGGQYGFVLVESLFGDARMKHEAKNVKVSVLESDGLANEFVLSAGQYLVVKVGVLPRKVRVPQALVLAFPAGHHAGRLAKHRQFRVVQTHRRLRGAVGFETQSKLIDLVKLALSDLRRRAKADQVRLQHQPFTLEPT